MFNKNKNLEKIGDQHAESGDLAGALVHLEVLADQHPASAAVPAEVVRLLAGHWACADEGLRAAKKALTLAIRGGAPRMGFKVAEQLDAGRRERLELDARVAEELAKSFAARGDEATASRLRA